MELHAQLMQSVRRTKMKDKTNSRGRAEGPDQEAETRPCPKCGAEMMKGEMRGGLSNGRSAWVCTNFPQCGYIEMVRTPEEQVILDRLEKGIR